MNQKGEAPVVISADTSAFNEAMKDITASTEQFGRVFASTMRRAVFSGRDLDDTLRGIALRFADLALAQALSPIENAISGLVSGALSGPQQAMQGGSQAASGPRITFNVNSPDAVGFGKSEAQISAMLARAVSRGQRGL